MSKSNRKYTQVSSIRKDLKYSVAAPFIDFQPAKYTPRTIIFEGRLAIQLKGRVYTQV